MCTYNSARFLRPQLESMEKQTFLPDEVVVCDDGSTDDTLEILEKWKETAPFNVRFSKNPKNLGYTKNFERAVSLCGGDLIFLSDHDDVWFPNRVERTVEAFEADDALGLVTSDAQIIDADGVEQGMKLREFVDRMRLKDFWMFFFPQDVRMELWTGCTMALRRREVQKALPIPAAIACHDVWFYITMALASRVAYIPEPLIAYRLHGQNHSTAPTVAFLRENPSQWNYFSAFIETLNVQHPQLSEILLNFVQTLPSAPRLERYARRLRKNQRHFSARSQMVRHPGNLILECLNGGYLTHPQPFRSILYDLREIFRSFRFSR